MGRVEQYKEKKSTKTRTNHLMGNQGNTTVNY